MPAPPAQIGRHAAEASPRDRQLRPGAVAKGGAMLPHVARQLCAPFPAGCGREAPGIQPHPALDQVRGVHASLGVAGLASERRSARDPAHARAGDLVQPPPRPSLTQGDFRVLPPRGEQPVIGEPAERLVQRAVRGQTVRAGRAGEELRKREPVQRVVAVRGDLENRELDRDQAVLAAAHIDRIAGHREFEYIFPLMATPPADHSGDLRLLGWQLLVAVGPAAPPALWSEASAAAWRCSPCASARVRS